MYTNNPPQNGAFSLQNAVIFQKHSWGKFPLAENVSFKICRWKRDMQQSNMSKNLADHCLSSVNPAAAGRSISLLRRRWSKKESVSPLDMWLRSQYTCHHVPCPENIPSGHVWNPLWTTCEICWQTQSIEKQDTTWTGQAELHGLQRLTERCTAFQLWCSWMHPLRKIFAHFLHAEVALCWNSKASNSPYSNFNMKQCSTWSSIWYNTWLPLWT